MSQPATILIVEDEAVLQDVYRMVLSTGGYNIHTANNGAEGIAALKRHRPDLVLLDIFMPVMDGKEFLQNIDTADYPDTKIIVYTNLSDSKTELEMRQLGADDFILKAALTPKDLLELVHRALTGK